MRGGGEGGEGWARARGGQEWGAGGVRAGGGARARGEGLVVGPGPLTHLPLHLVLECCPECRHVRAGLVGSSLVAVLAGLRGAGVLGEGRRRGRGTTSKPVTRAGTTSSTHHVARGAMACRAKGGGP